jgi:hypothetical protein
MEYVVGPLRTVMLSTRSDTLLAVIGTSQFCEIGVGIHGSEENRFVLESCISMYTEAIDGWGARTWFMPALAKRSVGSSYGMVDDEETYV